MKSKIFSLITIVAIIWAIGWVLKVISEPEGRNYSGYGAYEGRRFNR